MTTPPIDLVHQLPALDKQLLALLNSLTPEEWQAQTVAKKWKVKDVVVSVVIPARAFWQLVSKSKRYADLQEVINITGEQSLAQAVLSLVSFIA